MKFAVVGSGCSRAFVSIHCVLVVPVAMAMGWCPRVDDAGRGNGEDFVSHTLKHSIGRWEKHVGRLPWMDTKYPNVEIVFFLVNDMWDSRNSRAVFAAGEER